MITLKKILTNSLANYTLYSFRTSHALLALTSHLFFTNIPVKKTICIILDKLFQGAPTTLSLTDPLLVNFLELACTDIHFLFNKTIYTQTDGVAMGT